MDAKDKIIRWEVLTYKGGLEVAHVTMEDANGMWYRMAYPGRIRTDGRGY